jgi:hypothetical protein
MTKENTPSMQVTDTARVQPSGGNQVKPLSPKAIRLLRAHDAASSSVTRPASGTGDTKNVSD